MSNSTHVWFTMFATVGAVSGALAVVLLWLILTRPLQLMQALAGLP